jgi:CRISPR/Cas system-associated exonuclease Cas4 (RecB family)
MSPAPRSSRPVLHHLRQQGQHRDGVPNRSNADFVAPRDRAGDHMGAFAVTAGVELPERVAAFKAEHDDYSAILLESLADRLAEAFAERLHERVRREFWGYAPTRSSTTRPHRRALSSASAPRRAIPPARTTPRRHHLGRCSTSRRAPACSSPSRWRCGREPQCRAGTSPHPHAQYFVVGRLGRDQVERVCRAQGLDARPGRALVATPNLGYDPDARLDVAPNGALRVVDYKTGRSPSELFERSSLFQMKFYALVLWRLHGVVPSVLQLVYLGNGEIVRYVPDEADLLATQRSIAALWRAIQKAAESGDWRPRRSRLCDWCDYRDLCPEWGGTPPPLPADAQQRAIDPEVVGRPAPADD